ncbi:MAG: hypothetical protein ACLQIH_10065 [Myxococcaceae bacterium]
MRARSAAVQGAIAASALALAAATWLRGPDSASTGGVVIADVPAGSVQRVVWDDGSHRVEVERERQGEPGVWVRIARSPSLRGPDAGVDAGPRPAPLSDGGSPSFRAVDAGPRADAGPRPDGGGLPPEVAPAAPDRELRGTEAAEKVLEQFSPFTATRALGVPDAAKVRELGLQSGLRRLDVWTQSRHLSFEVSTPVGTGASYVRTEDGRVFVLGGALIQELSAAASRLVDRRVHAYRPEEADRVVVHLGAQSRTLFQRRVGGATKVFGDGHTDTPDAYAQGWVDRLNKVVPSDVLGRGEAPPEGEPRVELRVDFLRGGESLGFVELARAQTGWFARSEHSVGWMRVVGRAEGLMHDADRLMSTP